MKLDRKLLRECLLREIYSQVSPSNKKTITVKDVPVSVELATSDEQRNKGLMFRNSMPYNSGMLFDFNDTDLRGFWMKNTPMPLSIAFIDSNGIIVNIEDMEPYSLESSYSSRPCRYALEMNQGWFRDNGVEPGDKCFL